MIKLSDYVMQRIAAEGVKHVFLVPGGAAMHLNDSLGNTPGLEYVANLHEQASAIAAEAYSRVTNGLGVAMVTAGPGATNAISGIASAWLDSTPLVVLSGQVKRADLQHGPELRQFGIQELDIVSIVRPITKYAVTVMEPAEVRYHLEKALFLARDGRQGPVWLDFPLDVQAAKLEPAALGSFEPETPKAPAARLSDGQQRAVMELLEVSERPILLGGNGIRAAGAMEDFRRLAETLQIPVLTTWLGIDLLPENHPLFVGRPGSIAPRGANFALQNSDLLIVLGARLDMGLMGQSHENFAREARKVVVDIDPAEIAKLRFRVDVDVCADVGAVIRGLQDSVASRPMPIAVRESWLSRCRSWKARYPVLSEVECAPKLGVSTYAFSEALSSELREGELIVTGSSGSAIEIFLLAYKVKSRQRIFHSRGLGAMGFGLPASIGACLAAGRRRTICVDADGGFLFNIQELETVRRLDLPIKFFVLNNGGYASIRNSQRKYFGRLVAADSTSGMSLPNLLRVAEAFGLATARIETISRLEESIREVLLKPGPVICDVVVPSEEKRAPSLASVQKPDGSMASRPLEDLWPFLSREELRENMLIPLIED